MKRFDRVVKRFKLVKIHEVISKTIFIHDFDFALNHQPAREAWKGLSDYAF